MYIYYLLNLLGDTVLYDTMDISEIQIKRYTREVNAMVAQLMAGFE